MAMEKEDGKAASGGRSTKPVAQNDDLDVFVRPDVASWKEAPHASKQGIGLSDHHTWRTHSHVLLDSQYAARGHPTQPKSSRGQLIHRIPVLRSARAAPDRHLDLPSRAAREPLERK